MDGLNGVEHYESGKHYKACEEGTETTNTEYFNESEEELDKFTVVLIESEYEFNETDDDDDISENEDKQRNAT